MSSRGKGGGMCVCVILGVRGYQHMTPCVQSTASRSRQSLSIGRCKVLLLVFTKTLRTSPLDPDSVCITRCCVIHDDDEVIGAKVPFGVVPFEYKSSLGKSPGGPPGNEKFMIKRYLSSLEPVF